MGTANSPHIASGPEPGLALPQLRVEAGAVFASAGLPCLAAELFAGGLFHDPVTATVALLSSAAFLLSSLHGITRPGLPRLLFALGVASSVGLSYRPLLRSPMLAQLILVFSTGMVALIFRDQIFPATARRLRLRRRAPLLSARGAGVTAGLLFLLTDLVTQTPTPVVILGLGWAVLATDILSVAWIARFRARYARRSLLVVVLLGVQGLVIALTYHHPFRALALLALFGVATAFAVKSPPPAEDQRSVFDLFAGHPERLLVGSFAAMSLLGTLLLALPQSAEAGHRVGALDAMFTAVSAVCVTGLAVLNTPTDFSLFGQCMILLLIQVGGLGIMTFSTAAAWAFGRRLSMRHEQAAASLLGTTDRSQLFASARRVLQFTFSVEAVGFLLLALAFLQQGDPLGTAVYRGLFTAISAFCNAGFALQTDSLVPYQQSPMILYVVSLLIILGGLSPTAALAIPALLRRRRVSSPAAIHLILLTNAALLLIGFVMILALEWNGALKPLSALDRVHNAFFQSVTTRTAGFNSIDLTAVGPATLSLFMLLMFIGGSPGGTAGGIKVTTLAVLFLSVVQTMLGLPHASFARRRIPGRTIQKAALVVTVSALGFFLALISLQVTQRMPFSESMFEVMSALGTVGLTIGGTARLDEIGKVIIAGCMFVGRVGGLSLLLLLVSRYQRDSSLAWPEEDVVVG